MMANKPPRSEMRRIPFHKPFIGGNELHHVARAITTGRIAADGEYTQRSARLLEEKFGLSKVLMTPSCTAALELAATLCNLAPGDEVIMPSFTFVSAANAIVRLGARPVFVEIRPDTLNLDESRIEEALTSRTRAIMPMHYAGVACQMEEIQKIANDRGLVVIEDAAQAVNAFYKGRALGSFGQLATYSFHDTKNVVCGEGGALAINDPALFDRAEILRDKGTDRAKFFRGEVDKYTWVDVGSSYLPSEIACAFLYGQLEMMDEIAARRAQVFERYRARLQPMEQAGRLRPPVIPESCVSHGRNPFIVLNDKATRDALMASLRREGITASFHYVPLHSSPVGRTFGYREGDLEVTEDLAGRLLRLPAYPDIEEKEQARVVEHIAAFFERNDVARKKPHAPHMASSPITGAIP